MRFPQFNFFAKSIFTLSVAGLMTIASCGSKSSGENNEAEDEDAEELVEEDIEYKDGDTDLLAIEDEEAPRQGTSEDIPMKSVTIGSKTYKVADINDKSAKYKTDVNKDKCFIVISKKEYRLYVYEVVDGDTVLVAHFPVCYAKNPENKERKGDMKTPECSMSDPFSITEIIDASDWEHDFGDGRGKFPAYGHWFMRLKTPPHTGIGIHGSTGNAESVPGRDSEGCIRLRDNDLLILHDKYAKAGQKVIIKSIKQGKLPFEKKAEKALGDTYKAPKPGNPVVSDAGDDNSFDEEMVLEEDR